MFGGPLTRSFYARHPVEVARDLLHKLLVRRSRDGLTVGRIVEVEAYLAEEDSACHAARGRTPRNAVMFGRPGLLYVYAIHSRHCLNVVTEARGIPSAVLIRAVEPITGVEIMAARRGLDGLFDLARGPGRLCEAFAVDRRLNGWDLTRRQRIWLQGDHTCRSPKWSPRIGVTSAEQLELRCFADGSRFVSGPRKFHSRSRR